MTDRDEVQAYATGLNPIAHGGIERLTRPCSLFQLNIEEDVSVGLVDCHIASQKIFKRQNVQTLIAHPVRATRLQLALPGTSQLGASACNAELTSLLHLGLEDDHIALLPHLGHQRLAGDHNTCKADLDVLELAVSPHNRLAGNTERAQTVKDGLLEAADLAELGVDVQRVAVAR